MSVRSTLSPLAIFSLALLASTLSRGAETVRVSVNNAGEGANNLSTSTSPVSADGRFVVFSSNASNLVDGVTTHLPQIFLRDVEHGETTCIVRNSNGELGNAPSTYPAMTPDGRYVTYASAATNLVPTDLYNMRNVFLLDRETQITTRVSHNSSGVAGNGTSDESSISADGRYIAFASNATNLVAGFPASAGTNIFLHDRDTGQTTWVSQGVDSLGTDSRLPRISGDGRVIAFRAQRDNAVAADTNGVADVFVHVIATGVTTRVSVSTAGTEAHGASGETGIGVSADGRYVVFDSSAAELVPNDTNGQRDIFLHDRTSGTTQRISVGPDGVEANNYCEQPAISADGRHAAYISSATNLLPYHINFSLIVHLRDLVTQQNERVTYSSMGSDPDARSMNPAVSADGRFVTFASHARNLTDNDTNGFFDIFRHDHGGPAPAQRRSVYVDHAAPPGGDGRSWDNAFDNLQTALQTAQSGDVLRVAQGNYAPAGLGGPRTATFRLKDHVELRGGYAGSTSANPAARDVVTYETVLSGDLNQDDRPGPFSDCCAYQSGPGGCDDPQCTAAVCAVDAACCTNSWSSACATLADDLCPDACGSNNDNSYHVIICVDKPATTVVDGLTIRGGAAETGSVYSNGTGGGMCVALGAPVIRNCTFESNWARNDGGAVAIRGPVAAQFVNCAFMNNASGYYGGAMTAADISAVVRCSFFGNRSFNGGGGAVAASGTPSLEDCIFVGNRAEDYGGAVYASPYEGAPRLRNCTFTSNTAGYQGGGVYLRNFYEPDIVGCTFFDNVTGGAGGGLAIYGGMANVVACAFFNNRAVAAGGGMDFQACAPRLHNCVLSGNTSTYGGAVHFTGLNSPATISHSTFSANQAEFRGGGIFHSGGPGSNITNCLFWENGTTSVNTIEMMQIDHGNAIVTHSCVQGLDNFASRVGNIGSSPIFVDADGPDGLPGTADDDLRLDAGSPCIDAGNNAAVPADALDLDGDGDVAEPAPLDAAGHTRFWDDPASADCTQPGAVCGSAPLADMGAFEFGAPPPLPGDYDHDGVVTLFDYAWLCACLSGPQDSATFTPPSGACRASFDADTDLDVDLRDFADFANNLHPPER